MYHALRGRVVHAFKLFYFTQLMLLWELFVWNVLLIGFAKLPVVH